MVHKVAVVRTLITRADNLSSAGVKRADEVKQATDALKSNGQFLAYAVSVNNTAAIVMNVSCQVLLVYLLSQNEPVNSGMHSHKYSKMCSLQVPPF